MSVVRGGASVYEEEKRVNKASKESGLGLLVSTPMMLTIIIYLTFGVYICPCPYFWPARVLGSSDPVCFHKPGGIF